MWIHCLRLTKNCDTDNINTRLSFPHFPPIGKEDALGHSLRCGSAGASLRSAYCVPIAFLGPRVLAINNVSPAGPLN